ncbi:hypothetical protein ACFQ9D_15755 [Arthrobacter koreensis]|uniref:hypothetical protein n=1 Tax=Arthrobacter koreensis TaxID=199136 RepID=UPI003672EBF7
MPKLGASQGAPTDLDTTEDLDLGAVIRTRIEDAEKENQLRGQRGRSWALDGRQPALVWQSRTKWLAGTAAELACIRGRQLCRKWRVSARTALLVARACARLADADTGRRVTASNETIGRIAAELADRSRPFCHDVVSNARAVLAELELAVEVARGRYLTVDERFQAAVHHDGVQLRAASTWALTTPRRWYAKSYLPRRGPTGSKTPRRQCSPTHARKRASAPFGRSQGLQERERPRQAHIVTAQLVAAATSLDNGQHLGALVDVVAEMVDCDRWTGRDLVAVLNQDARENPRDWPSTIQNPAGFLRHRLSWLRDVLAGPSPSEVAEQHRQRTLEEQRRRAEAAAAADERAATPEQVSRHMDAIRSILRRRQRGPVANDRFDLAR